MKLLVMLNKIMKNKKIKKIVDVIIAVVLITLCASSFFVPESLHYVFNWLIAVMWIIYLVWYMIKRDEILNQKK
jgi:hypothetical protein